MATGSPVTTAEELLRLPRGTWRYELVTGELRTMSPSGHVHGKIAARVAARLLSFVEEHGLGVVYGAETGFILQRSPDTVRAPDAAFVTNEHLATTSLVDDGYFPGAPDLAVEVLSPSDSSTEVETKVTEWLTAGCQAVVVMDPKRKVATVHRPGSEPVMLTQTEQITLSDLLPGWSLDLAKILE